MGLFDIFSAKDAQQAAKDKAAGYQTGLQNATGAINTGLGNATGSYNNAQGYYGALSGTANNAFNAYGDALGSNGAEGTKRAQAAFTGSPGYQYAMDQAMANTDRGAAARGTVSSGGNQVNELGTATNLANQNYSNYLSSFAPMLGAAQNIAQGQAGISTGLGNLQYDSGKTLGGLNYNAATGIGDANAAGDMAPYNASSNMWNLFTANAKSAAEYFGAKGKGPGGGGGGST